MRSPWLRMPERVCFLLKVRQNRLEEYKERHREVWADMRQALSETGWHNYSLFLRGDGLLVGYLETDDFRSGALRNGDDGCKCALAGIDGPFF